MKRKRHDPAAALTAEPAMLYRCGTRGKRYKTKHGAYMAEAARIFYAAYPGGGKHAARLGEHTYPFPETAWDAAWRRDDRIVYRLARWLRWRDGRRAVAQ